jgi:hypothetical protein
MIRRTEISIETHRVMTIRRRGRLTRSWCDGCLAEVQMITPNEAAAIAGVGSRAIYRWIEESRVHFIEDPSKLILVCVPSIPSAT